MTEGSSETMEGTSQSISSEKGAEMGKEQSLPPNIPLPEAIQRMKEKGPIRGEQDVEPPKGLPEEQVEAWRQASGKLGNLIPEKGKKTDLTDESLVRLAQLAAMPHNQSRVIIENLIASGDNLFISGQVGVDQWSKLGGALRELADTFPSQEREGFFREYEYDTQVGAELDMRPVQPPFDTSWPPKYFTSSTEARRHGLELNEWQRLLRARAQLANACAIKLEKKDTDLVATKDNPLFNFKREELRLMYEMPGVKQSLWRFFDELFIGEKKDEEGRVRGRIRLRLKPAAGGENGDPGALVKLLDVEGLKKRIWSREGDKSILKDGIVENEIDARAAVAAAWNLIFISNTVESADLYRDVEPCPAYGEQPRALCHPLSKAMMRYKLKEIVNKEGKIEEFDENKVRPWGGNHLGNWLKERVIKDPQFRARFKDGEIRPFPETMCVSLLEFIEVDDKGTTLAEKILNQDDEGIDWNKVSQETAGAYKDFMDTAVNGFTFATGLREINLKDPTTRREWATKLGDVIGKMRPKILGDEYDRNDFVIWSIAASVGLKRQTSELYLNIPENIYSIVLDGLLKEVLVDDKKKIKEVKAQLMEKNVFSGAKRTIVDWKRVFTR